MFLGFIGFDLVADGLRLCWTLTLHVQFFPLIILESLCNLLKIYAIDSLLVS